MPAMRMVADTRLKNSMISQAGDSVEDATSGTFNDPINTEGSPSHASFIPELQ